MLHSCERTAIDKPELHAHGGQKVHRCCLAHHQQAASSDAVVPLAYTLYLYGQQTEKLRPDKTSALWSKLLPVLYSLFSSKLSVLGSPDCLCSLASACRLCCPQPITETTASAPLALVIARSAYKPRMCSCLSTEQYMACACAGILGAHAVLFATSMCIIFVDIIEGNNVFAEWYTYLVSSLCLHP